MMPPPVIVSIPKDTPKSPGPPPPLPAGQSGPAVVPPPQQQTAQQVPPPPPKKKRWHHRKPEEAQAAAAPPAEAAQHPAASNAQQTPAASNAQQPAAVQPSVPVIAQVLTDDERRDYTAHVSASLDNANRNLTSVGNRQLSPQQKTMLNQVQSFIKQAQEAEKTDLVTARSLAERADLLSQDLRDSLQ